MVLRHALRATPSVLALCALLIACTTVSDSKVARYDGPDEGALGAASTEGLSSESAARLAFIRAQQGRAGARYALEDDGTSVYASYTVLGLSAAFDSAGMHLHGTDAAAVTLTLAAIGRDGAMLAAEPATELRAESNRLSMQHGAGLEQWWLSGPLGLEQGFSLQAPPAGAASSEAPLVLRVELDGATAEADGEGGARLLPDDGAASLRYTDLFAEDADGMALPTEMVVASGGIELRIDDVGARYPQHIDPLVWNENQKLLASDGATEDRFGWKVSVSGNFAIVTAAYDDDNGDKSGSAYVFERDANGPWIQKQKLLASDGVTGDFFGASASVSGDYAIVGASAVWANDKSGAAYIFERDLTGNWTEKKELLATDGAPGEEFGAVSVRGD